MAFIETPRFPADISQGSSGGPMYSTDVVTVNSGYESRNSEWVEARREYDAAFGVRDEEQMYTLLEYFMAMKGMAHSFRFKDWGDYKSCATTETISDTDQTIGTGDGVEVDFQLIKKYTQGLTAQRDIKKPVSGTVVISIDDVGQPAGWSVDTATGIVSFDADNQISATDASSADPAELTFTGHGLSTGDTVYLSGFTGDWSALNDARYSVTVTGTDTFTIDVDTTGFTAYSSNGGQMNTIPQSGEVIKAGYEFDVPCRFNSDQFNRSFDNYMSGSTSVPIIEVRV